MSPSYSYIHIFSSFGGMGGGREGGRAESRLTIRRDGPDR